MTKFYKILSVFALLLSLCFTASAQEQTGNLEVTVKDQAEALIPNATITIESAGNTAGFKKTATTGENGFQRFLQVRPGTYTVKVTAPGFGEQVIENVRVELGKTTPVNAVMTVGTGTNVVDVDATNADIIPLDVTGTKIQTNISAETAELLPKGTNFSSLLKVSPATRVEPLNGGFQIDGASGSENTFIIDGQEVTNAVTGTLNGNSNLPFQLIQEIQIKSSGFEAEYGGATGGVINVVTKGGNNTFRGEFGSQFELESLQPVGRNILFLNTSRQPELFPPSRDNFLGLYPTGNLSGPILKNRLWFFASYTPQIFTNERTITYLDPQTRVPTGDVETYSAKQINHYAFTRIDAQPFSRLRLTGSYTWNPITQRGSIPGFSSALSTIQSQPGNPSLSGGAFLDQTGGRQNSQSVTGQAIYTPLNNMVVSFRAGHYFLNEKLGTYGQGDNTIPRVVCSTGSPQQFPNPFGCLRGQNNGIPFFQNKSFDATERNTVDADVTYITTFGGRHEFKGGYQYNGLANQLLNAFTDQIILRYGQPIATTAGVSGLQSTPGAVGAGFIRVVNESGDVSSKNEAFYFQDKWQPTKRLTLNLGVRTERENVPSFSPGSPDLVFDFQDKIAPRLGAAYDLTGDGKTKLSVFYGWFYDRFKYELPRGSFGGQFFHDFFFEILPGDTLGTFTRQNLFGSGQLGIAGGSCPENTITPVFGRIRCDKDFRVPSNAGLGINFGAVDPNIKAFRQSEFTVTFERELNSKFIFSSRYSYKNVDVAVEDAGFINGEGSEAYIIGNPGQGLYRETAENFGFLGNLQPKRRYDALEFRLDRRFADNYYFNLNYTYSRLDGNYSGLASSDEDGRTSPNVNRFFDLPQAGYTVAGGPDNGRLATDRPHALKFYGAYSLNWQDRFKFGGTNVTEFQVFTTVQSGTPLTTVIDLFNIDTIPLFGRGDLGRTETFTQTDFALRHRYRFGKDNRFTLVLETDLLNIFNEANELSRVTLINENIIDPADPQYGLVTAGQFPTTELARAAAIRRFQENGAPGIISAIRAMDNFPLYNITSGYQAPREVRFGIRLLF